MITPHQISLVEASWAKVVPIADTAAHLFYTKLFELDPSLRLLFKNELTEQGRKLMQMIGLAVGGLRRLDDLLPAVQALGRRHVAYGVEDAHYATVATALLWTLEQGLGPEFTPELRAAWTETYLALAGAMQKAA